MTINLAAIESRNEERKRLRDAATPGPWDYRYYYCTAGVSDGSHKDWCGLKSELFGQCAYCHNGPPVQVHTDELGQNWHVHRFESDDWRTVYAADGTKVIGSYDYEEGGVASNEQDAALIAYARTDTAPEDIAALLAEVRRLEGEQVRLRNVAKAASKLNDAMNDWRETKSAQRTFAFADAQRELNAQLGALAALTTTTSE